jgi:hypothetical protein
LLLLVCLAATSRAEAFTGATGIGDGYLLRDEESRGDGARMPGRPVSPSDSKGGYRFSGDLFSLSLHRERPAAKHGDDDRVRRAGDDRSLGGRVLDFLGRVGDSLADIVEGED